MDTILEHIDLFEAYQAKTLENSDVLEFEARLNSDVAFREAYQQFISIDEGLKRHYKNEFLSQFKSLDEQLDKELEQNKKSPIKKIIFYSTSIAASFLIFFLGYSYFKGTSNSIEIAKQNWPVEIGLPVTMATSKGKYDEAMNAFKLEEWEKAIKAFNKIDSDTSIYFLGEISYKKSNYKKAIHYFESIPIESSYAELALFKKALCYILLNDKENAVIILNSLSRSPSNQYSVLAKKVLKGL